MPIGDKNPWDVPKPSEEFEKVVRRYMTPPLGEGHLDVASAPKGDPRFHALLKQIGDLHDIKQQGYGTHEDPLANVRASEAFGIPAWVGAMVRANDKMKRLQTYVKQETLPCESVEDAFMDLAVYALIGLILFREQPREQPPTRGR